MTPRASRTLAASFLSRSLAVALVLTPLVVPAAPAVPASPASYEVARTSAPSGTLLAADEAAWAAAASVDWGPAAYATRFRALWSDDGLHLRFDASDSLPWHTMTRRDEHLWEEEVVEIFLDPDRSGRDYYELEISPANVVCDLHMISPMPNYKSDFAWDLAGLETRVHATKDTAGRTTGWTATAFLPWGGLRALPSAARVATPPRPGDRWRFNVFRIERPFGPREPDRDALFLAWSPTGERSFHVPLAFREIEFAAE